MKQKRYNLYFFLIILAAISAITYFIFQPFFLAIMLAGILAVALQRPYSFFVKITGGRKGLSSMLISLFGVIVLVVFMGGIVGIVAEQAGALYQSTVSDGNAYHKYAEPVIAYVNQNKLLVSLGFDSVITKDTIGKSATQIGQGAFVLIQKTYQGVASGIFFIIVIFFTLYYLLIEGKNLVEQTMQLSPLKDSYERILIAKFISISKATAKGALTIALIQGIIGMLLFLALGIPSAFILGIAMMFFSLIPIVGSGFIWVPTALVMFITGNIWQGWVILIVGFGILSSIDNFLRPKLVGKNTQMHPLIVFFATLGGISLFGFLGFIIGPVIVALFLALWDIYAKEFKSQLKKYNA